MSKRISDVFLAVIGLLVTWPLFLLLALLIKLDSAGPVFFRQVRVGRHGRPFRIFKFRTMLDNAYLMGPRLTQKRDPRITRIGHVLRWLKLDELPQLLNVVKGDMSLVGPRPEDPCFVERYTHDQRAVLSVRPGIVGPSQILGRDELEKYPDGVVDTERYYIEHILPEKLATDLDYVRRYGLAGDLRLIARGLGVTLFGAFKAKFFRLNKKRILLLALDTAASLVVYLVAFGIKFEWTYEPDSFTYVAVVCLLILTIRPLIFLYFGLYQNIVRYLGTREFLAITKAATVGSVLIVTLTFMLGLQAHSRLVLLIDWGLLIPVLFGARVARKTWLQYRRQMEHTKNVLIVGATDVGEQLASAMVNQRLPYRPVGFLDDDPVRRGVSIHGIRVLGSVGDLPLVAALGDVDLVVILFPHVSSTSLRQLVDFCRSHNLEYRLVPTLDRLLQGGVFLPEFDEPELRELLTPTPDPRPSQANGQGNGDGKIDGRTPAASRRSDSERPPVLVTGGAGYIGSHVVRKLLGEGRRVRVIDSFLYGVDGLRDVSDEPRLELIEGDIRHLRTMAIAAKGVDSVIALAALVGDAACQLDVEETMSTNLEATELLADVCERSGVRRLVFASSCSVYGANSQLVLNEGSWLQPVSVYARTRILSEEALLRRRHRLGVTILRLATVFGLSSRMRLDLLVNTFTAHAFFNRRIQVFGGGQCRPNLHVQDAADAFILAADAADDMVRGEIFNVGDNTLNYSVLEIAKYVQAQLPHIEVGITREAADPRDYRVSFDKIRHVLGYRTRFTVEDGIVEMIRAFHDGWITTPSDERYHNFRHLEKHGFQPSLSGAAAKVLPMGA